MPLTCRWCTEPIDAANSHCGSQSHTCNWCMKCYREHDAKIKRRGTK